jgi:AraC-like DNA-binding protein
MRRSEKAAASAAAQRGAARRLGAAFPARGGAARQRRSPEVRQTAPWSHSYPDWIVLAEYYDHRLNVDNPLWFTVERVPQPTPLRVHIHKGMDVLIHVSGGYEMECGDVARSAEPGEVFLLSMWEPHAWRWTEPDSVLVVFCFLPEILETELSPELSLLTMFTVPPSRRPMARTPELRRLALSVAEEAMREYDQRRMGHAMALRVQLLRLLIALRREWRAPAASEVRRSLDASYVERIQPAVTLANSRPMRQVHPSEAAAACGLSLSRFHEIFTQTMGLSYGEFCLRARLAFAAHMLLSTSMPVDAVAREAGFTDGSHLYHRFLEHYRRTPSDYRKEGQFTSPPIPRRRSLGRSLGLKAGMAARRA